MKLSQALSRIAASRTTAITDRVIELRAAGKDVISLSVGEPDFDTPDTIKAAAKAAIDQGETKYTALDGSPALKAAVRGKFLRENGLDYATDEIIVGAGAKQILYNAMMASLNDGDEVIIPMPCWTSYLDIVKIAGGVPVPITCGAETGFRVTHAQLEAAHALLEVAAQVRVCRIEDGSQRINQRPRLTFGG